MNGLKACLNKLKFLPLDKHANRIFPLWREWRHCWAVVVLRPQVHLGSIINESKHNLEKHYSCLLAKELGCKCWTWFLSAQLFQNSHGGCHPAQVCLWARRVWAWRALAVPEHVPWLRVWAGTLAWAGTCCLQGSPVGCVGLVEHAPKMFGLETEKKGSV